MVGMGALILSLGLAYWCVIRANQHALSKDLSTKEQPSTKDEAASPINLERI